MKTQAITEAIDEWEVFEDTEYGPLAEIIDFHGEPVPLQHCVIENLIVYFQHDNGIWVAYWSAEPDDYASRWASPEAAVNALRVMLWEDQPTVHTWRAVSSEDYRKQMEQR